MDGPGALIGFAIDMPVAPHFDSPYLSASLTEFWSKRWNLTVGNALRFLAFDPIHEGASLGRTVKQGQGGVNGSFYWYKFAFKAAVSRLTGQCLLFAT